MGTLQSLLDRISLLLAEPILLFLGVPAFIAYIVLIYADKTREYAIGLLIFLSMCSPNNDWFGNWIRPAAPFDSLVLYARPLTALMLITAVIILNISNVSKSSQNIKLSIPGTLKVLIFLQLLFALRVITSGFVVEGLLRGATFIIVFIFGAVIVARQIRHPDDLRQTTRQLAVAFTLYVATTLIMMRIGWNQGFEVGRWFGLTNNANSNAGLIAMYLPAVIALAASPIEKKKWRLIWLSAASLSSIPLLLSGSRGGLLIAITTMVILFRQRLGKMLFALIPIVVCILLASFFIDGGLRNPFVSRGINLDTRQDVWSGMIEVWLENPIFGSPGGTKIRESSYLGVLERLGLVGFSILLLAIAMAFGLIHKALKHRQQLGPYALFSDAAIAGTVAIGLSFIIEASLFSNLNQTIFAMYFYLALLTRSSQVSYAPPQEYHQLQP